MTSRLRCSLLAIPILWLLAAAKPAPAQIDSLRAELEAIADGFHGTIGYSLHHLETGDTLSRLGDEQFPTASTIKLAILVTAMEKVEQGEIDYDDARPLTEQDRQYGTGLLHNYRAETSISFRELLDLMIAHSDNTATIMLGQWIGTDAVNGWLARHGLGQTRLLVPFPYQGSFEEAQAQGGDEWDPLRVWGIGVTTPNEMRSLMEMTLDDRGGTPAGREEMQRILRRQYYDDGIASQVPPGVSVASKHGSEDATRSDVAIVHSPSGDFVLAIYTKAANDTGVKWDNEQDTTIRSLSRAVWRYYHPRSRWSPPAGSERFYLFQTEPCYPGMPCWTDRR
ncbi:MAG TPA: serine hydrolase [Gemmatimonadota bacterium]|nr:serine hydrolase [Gemmatimonadota bacterium]